MPHHNHEGEKANVEDEPLQNGNHQHEPSNQKFLSIMDHLKMRVQRNKLAKLNSPDSPDDASSVNINGYTSSKSNKSEGQESTRSERKQIGNSVRFHRSSASLSILDEMTTNKDSIDNDHEKNDKIAKGLHNSILANGNKKVHRPENGLELRTNSVPIKMNKKTDELELKFFKTNTFFLEIPHRSDFHTIFGNVSSKEQLIVAYPCAWQKEISTHGRAFLSTNYLSFYACFLQSEESVQIPYKDITSVTREKSAVIIPNAIKLRTKNDDEYLFACYVPREKIFANIFRMWQNALLDRRFPMTQNNDLDPTNSLTLNKPIEDDNENATVDFQSDIHANQALILKIKCVNDAIDEIGFTRYHLKLFFLNGFGYAVDSLLLLLNSLTQPQITLQYQPIITTAQTISVGIGLLVGALFWGIGADLIGRRYAFNITLLLCAIFAIATGAAPNFISVCILISLMAFSGGGNLILDTAVYLEFLPGKYQWSLTFMAAWWGIGQMVASLVAWPFMAMYSCSNKHDCTNTNNSGWRYTFYTLGGFVFILSILRIVVIRMKESPKWLLSQNKDAEVVRIIHEIAQEAGKQSSLTLQQLESFGSVRKTSDIKQYQPMIVIRNIRGLFPNRRMAYSTFLNMSSWALIGLAYPLYNVFLPYYLRSRGAIVGDDSIYTTYRNYAITNVCTIFGPVVAGVLVENHYLGRRYTMSIGALLTMAFLFAYTTVRTAAQNLTFACMISFCLNIYYGTLYAYTPEVLPSEHRGTGNAIIVACNRIMGIVAAVVGMYADLSSNVPIYVCAAAFGGLAFISFLFPFEPRGSTSG
ncbi:unnamed protein product [Rotaria socialis]